MGLIIVGTCSSSYFMLYEVLPEINDYISLIASGVSPKESFSEIMDQVKDLGGSIEAFSDLMVYDKGKPFWIPLSIILGYGGLGYFFYYSLKNAPTLFKTAFKIALVGMILAIIGEYMSWHRVQSLELAMKGKGEIEELVGILIPILLLGWQIKFYFDLRKKYKEINENL